MVEIKSCVLLQAAYRALGYWVVPRQVSKSCLRQTQNEVAAVIPEPDESSMDLPYPRVSFPDRQRPPKRNFVRLRINRASPEL